MIPTFLPPRTYGISICPRHTVRHGEAQRFRNFKSVRFAVYGPCNDAHIQFTIGVETLFIAG